MFPFLKKSSFFARTFISPILSISNPQWGKVIDSNNNTTIVSLPVAYKTEHFFATAVDWGQSGKAYGIAVTASTLSVMAPVTPFSVFYLSVGV